MSLINQKIIYTIGTGLRPIDDFIRLLAHYEISNLIDVRSFPKSRLHHFDRDIFSELLAQEGIAYHFLGRELGGFRKGGYEAYAATGPFLEGIEEIERIASAAPSAVSCAEKFPWKCHRRWIARELQRRGWTVEHIIDTDNLWIPKKPVKSEE